MQCNYVITCLQLSACQEIDLLSVCLHKKKNGRTVYSGKMYIVFIATKDKSVMVKCTVVQDRNNSIILQIERCHFTTICTDSMLTQSKSPE